jgi:hypothetical protein
MKDPVLAQEQLEGLYRRFDDAKRAMADRVVGGWALSDDEGLRFDALAMIRTFKIASALPALRQLEKRLDRDHAPGAPFERENIQLLVSQLQRITPANR